MCLTVDKTFKTKKEAKEYKPLIASKDIVVYKILRVFKDGTYTSPFMNFKYEKGYQYTEDKLDVFIDLNLLKKYDITINCGLHAFLTKDNKMITMHMSYNNVARNISNNIAKYGYLKVVEMVVPKGSNYYLGLNNEIVTDNLIWY